MSLKEEILRQTQRDHRITGETFELFAGGSAVEQRAFLEQEVELARNMVLFGLGGKVSTPLTGAKDTGVVKDVGTTEAPLYVKDVGTATPPILPPLGVVKTKKGVDKTV
uniref:Uncharacterized protein n=1 Tax=viral metagenome TaxID=1070528 RepID=A0A6M3IHD0_9ZZZZ